MSLQWTGERLVTDLDSAFGTFEHLHRYALAVQLCQNKIVLDIASGEGYGSNLIADVATSVVGVDISVEAVEHAQKKYQRKNLQFKEGNTSKIPMESNSTDVVVSFETIEHINEQELFLSEIKRVLKENGTLILSTPDKDIYFEREANNPFHVKELTTFEFEALVKTYFKEVKLYQQRFFIGSVISDKESQPGQYALFDGNFSEILSRFDEHEFFNKAFFNIIVATDDESIGNNLPSVSLFSAYKTYDQERKKLMKQINDYDRTLKLILSSRTYKSYLRLIKSLGFLKKIGFQKKSKSG
jgi:ubiquinone/menaquinone biosynthesis C-methylase UbiE